MLLAITVKAFNLKTALYQNWKTYYNIVNRQDSLVETTLIDKTLDKTLRVNLC